jgi:DNA-binding transcriptional LysR family regulator
MTEPIGLPSLDQLAVFVAVADAGSFSGAARRLKRGQSVVSYQIANLEALLGVALFDRAGRLPVLTEAGRAILADARRATLVVDELRARAAALQQGLEAEVTLAVDVLFPVPALVDALADFSRAFPTVTLRLRMEALGGVVQSVLSGESALGVTGWACTLSEALKRQLLGRCVLFPVAAPGHILAAEAPVARSLAREQVQLVLADTSKLTEGQDFGVIGLKTWRLGDLGAKHALLLAGLGWGNMPAHLVEDDLKAGRLVRLSIEGEDPQHDYPMYLIERIDQPPGRAAAALKQRLEKITFPSP